MKKIKEKFVLEYSKKQKQFHIQTLNKAIKTNLQTILYVNEKHSPDYLIIGIFNNSDDAFDKIKEMEKMIFKI